MKVKGFFIQWYLGHSRSKQRTKYSAKISLNILNDSGLSAKNRSASMGFRNKSFRGNNLTFNKDKQTTQRNLNNSDSLDLRPNSRENLR